MAGFKKHYPVSLMESVLLTVGYNGEPMKIPASGPALASAQAFLPYCLKPLDGNRIIVLNRHYKPLGLSDYTKWVDYDEPQYQSLVVPADSIDVSTLTFNEKGSYYFFSDGNNPLSKWSRKPDKEIGRGPVAVREIVVIGGMLERAMWRWLKPCRPRAPTTAICPALTCPTACSFRAARALWLTRSAGKT